MPVLTCLTALHLGGNLFWKKVRKHARSCSAWVGGPNQQFSDLHHCSSERTCPFLLGFCPRHEFQTLFVRRKIKQTERKSSLSSSPTIFKKQLHKQTSVFRCEDLWSDWWPSVWAALQSGSKQRKMDVSLFSFLKHWSFFQPQGLKLPSLVVETFFPNWVSWFKEVLTARRKKQCVYETSLEVLVRVLEHKPGLCQATGSLYGEGAVVRK